MKQRLILLFSGFIAWTLFFLIGRGLFMLYHANLSNELSMPEMMLGIRPWYQDGFFHGWIFFIAARIVVFSRILSERQKLMAHLAWLPCYYFVYSNFYYRPRFRTVYTLGLPVGCNTTYVHGQGSSIIRGFLANNFTTLLLADYFLRQSFFVL